MSIKIITGNFCATVVRDGKSVVVKQGQPFDFDDEEVSDIERIHGAGALRNPRDESKDVESSDSADSADSTQKKAATKVTKTKDAPEL